MSANVSLLKAEIDRARPVGHKGAFEYDGKVVLRGKSIGLDFTYTYPFENNETVAEAVTQAAKMLARELSELANATQNVLRPEPQFPEEEDTEGPEDGL